MPQCSGYDRPHFHSTDDVIYVSARHPVDGSLKLRAYIVQEGGELWEFDYTKHWRGNDGSTRPEAQADQPAHPAR